MTPEQLEAICERLGDATAPYYEDIRALLAEIGRLDKDTVDQLNTIMRLKYEIAYLKQSSSRGGRVFDDINFSGVTK